MTNTIPTLKDIHSMIAATVAQQIATTRYGKALRGLPTDELTAAMSPDDLADRLAANIAGNVAQIMFAKIEEALAAAAETLAARGFDTAAVVVAELAEAA